MTQFADRERERENESKKESGIRIIKRGKRVVVSFSATLQMNSCNDPETLKRQKSNQTISTGLHFLCWGNDPSLSKGESGRIWVAIDIQMKGRQFGLVKAIMPTSACGVICVRVHIPGNTTLLVPASLCG